MTPDRSINVMHIALEPLRPRDTLPFDPDRDITESDWRKVRHCLKNERATIDLQNLDGDVTIYAAHLASAMITSPARFRDLADDEIFQLSRRYQDFLFPQPDIYRIVLNKIAFAKTREELGIDQDKLEKIIEECNQRRKRSLFLETVAGAVIIEPAILARLTHDESDWNWAQIEITQGSHDPVLLAISNLANAKIIFPQKIAGFLTPRNWNRWLQELQIFRQHGAWESFIALARRLSILAAREVKITERGLELVFDRSQPFTQPTIPMPPQKKF